MSSDPQLQCLLNRRKLKQNPRLCFHCKPSKQYLGFLFRFHHNSHTHLLRSNSSTNTLDCQCCVVLAFTHPTCQTANNQRLLLFLLPTLWLRVSNVNMSTGGIQGGVREGELIEARG